MSTIVVVHRKNSGPVPASGIHAELLGDLEKTAKWLLKLIELERSGIYDNLGQDFWVGSDSVLNTSRRLVELAEQRIAELRDAGAR